MQFEVSLETFRVLRFVSCLSELVERCNSLLHLKQRRFQVGIDREIGGDGHPVRPFKGVLGIVAAGSGAAGAHVPIPFARTNLSASFQAEVVDLGPYQEIVQDRAAKHLSIVAGELDQDFMLIVRAPC